MYVANISLTYTSLFASTKTLLLNWNHTHFHGEKVNEIQPNPMGPLTIKVTAFSSAGFCEPKVNRWGCRDHFRKVLLWHVTDYVSFFNCDQCRFESWMEWSGWWSLLEALALAQMLCESFIQCLLHISSTLNECSVNNNDIKQNRNYSCF